MKRKKIDLVKLKFEIYDKYPYVFFDGKNIVAVNDSHYNGWKEGVDFVFDLIEKGKTGSLLDSGID